MKKRFITIALCVMLFCLIPVTALAADHPLADGESLDISTCTAGDTVTIAAGAHVTLFGSNTNIRVICGAGANVMLSGVTIENSGLEYVCPLAFTGSGNSLILAEGTVNTLTAADWEPGVYVGGATALTISGTGKLVATGGAYGAGIGGREWSPACGTINITDGEIIANAGYYAAGIGGGYDGDGGSVTITGGQVTAAGGDGGPDLGNGGAGIGGGDNGNGGSVIISGGTVTATGGGCGAGIGGGNSGNGGIITISGSSTIVNATGGSEGGACIGSGSGLTTDGGTITIHGGTVTASSSDVFYMAAAIGGGRGSDCGDIMIDGGFVTATTAGGGPGIGSALITGESNGLVNISGGTVIATGYAGIGSGYGGEPDSTYTSPDINISGTANVTATGTGGAGLGGGAYSNAGNITISGGIVHATGNFESAGIGGGRNIYVAGGGGAGTIVISGGTVYASGDDTDDIGNGKNGSGGSLSISGTAAVFLAHDSYLMSVTALTHTHTTYTEDSEESYGYSIPADWTPNFGSFLRLVTLSYDANNGSGAVPDSGTQLYNTTASVAGGSGLSRTYYEYDGWNTADDGSGTSYAWGDDFEFTVNTTLYAQWTADSYTLTYDLDGGSVSPDNLASYTVESEAITLTNPTKSGYDFTGWSGTDITGDPVMTVTIPAGSTGNRAYTANWTARAYTLTYDLDGGSVSPVNPASYTVESAAITLTNPTKFGYDFTGWSGTGITGDPVMTVIIPSGSTGNRAYIAHWMATAYTLTYDLDSGSGSPVNPASYTVESEAITLNNPARAGYIFTGWSGTDIVGISRSVTIPRGSTGNRGYIAHWTAVITGLPQTYKMYEGGRVTWDPQPGGGTWDWDREFFSATFNNPATFTALKAGTSVITYTVNGIPQSITVTINASGLPQTGQDDTWIWVLCGAGVAVLIAAIFIGRRRRLKSE